MSKITTLLTLLLLPLYAQHSHAEFTPLGDLPGSSFESNANAVSVDGSVVVGSSYGGSGPGQEAFRWTQAGGMEGLGDLAGGIYYSVARGANADGSVIVGNSYGSNGYEAFVWTEAGGMVGLGDFTGASFNSMATAVNADGTVVVGHGHAASGWQAFRWTQAGGMVGLGDLAGGDDYSGAKGVNADGSVVVGFSNSANGYEAFRWTQAGGMVGLGDLAGGSFYSIAWAVNADGSVVVGRGESASGNEAFRWTQAGGMVGLGDLAGGDFESTANGVSADGSVVVGTGTSASGEEAFRWTQADGMQTVAEWLGESGVAVAADYTMQEAYGVSGDGSVVVGTSSGPSGTEAYLARAGSGSISLTELASSLDDAGTTSVVSINSVGLAINGAHSRPLSYRVAPGQNCGWVAGDWGQDDHGARDGDVALAEVGICHNHRTVQANIIIGKTWANQNLTLGGDVDQDGTYIMAEALMPLTKLSQGELWASLSAMYHWGDADITRGYLNAGLPDSSRGDTDSRTWALRARLEWDGGLQVGTAAISPYADLSYTETKVDGYTETGGGFPAVYNASKEETTELRLGLNAIKPVNSNTNVVGLVEAAHRFNNDGVTVGGTIVGLSDFKYHTETNADSWLRVGVGVEYKTGSGKASLMLNGTTQGETPNAWVAASWQAVF